MSDVEVVPMEESQVYNTLSKDVGFENDAKIFKIEKMKRHSESCPIDKGGP